MGLFSAIGSVIGGAVGGPIGASIGAAIGAGIEGQQAGEASGAASAAAAGARQLAAESAQERVDVAREFLADWESIYGGIEDNLSSFFSSLTPERFTALGLEAFQKEFQVAQTRISESFAQRGIPDSGLEISLDTLLEAKRAEVRAGIRTEAPFKVAEAQSKFLALGLPFKPGVQAGFTGALQARTSLLEKFATGQTAAAASAAESAGIIQGEAVSAIGNVLEQILNPPTPEDEPDVIP